MKQLIVLALVLAACGGTDAESTTTVGESTTTSSTSTTTTSSTTTTMPTTTTTVRPLTPADFLVELLVIGDECFGSAGALVTVEPELTLLSGDVTVETLIVFEISGLEDGSETFNLTVFPEGNYEYSQELLSTDTCDHELSVEVVSVRERGRAASSSGGGDDEVDFSQVCDTFEATPLTMMVAVFLNNAELTEEQAVTLIGVILAETCPDQYQDFIVQLGQFYNDIRQSVTEDIQEALGDAYPGR